jgi:glucose/arabinose dehydrogenase
MNFSGIFARVVALIGAGALQLRRLQGSAPEPAWGSAPVVPAAKPQGAIPTLKMPTARGWSDGQKPVAAAGLKVNAFARGLKHPRWINVLPNGNVLVAESNQVAGPVRSMFSYAMRATMRRASALGESANRITLFRDADGDGVAEKREIARITAPGRKLVTFRPGGHWTRSLLPSPDGRKLYAGVGSLSNIAEGGMEVEEGRAAIYELDLAGGTSRIFASGLRNAVGMAWEPQTGVLWTVVNERDGLGDETPPDYLTSVRDGGFYGWPYCYWGQTVDDRVPQDPAAVARAITPDYALGGHTASLGLCWLPAGTLPGFPDGMAIGQHGSWNRSTLSGYKVVFVPFENGRPSGPARDILSGFLAPDERESYGRPVGVTLGPDGSLLVADDVGDVIWRVTGEGQGA